MAGPVGHGNTPTLKPSRWVLFVTDIGRWTKDTYRSSQVRFRVSAACTKKSARSKDQGHVSLGAGLGQHLGVCMTASYFAAPLFFRVGFLVAFMGGPAMSVAAVTARSLWLCPPGPGLEKRPSLAWYLAQNGCLMNIY